MKWSCLAISVGSVVVSAGLLWMNSNNMLTDKPQQAVIEEVQQPEANIEKPFIVERKGEKIIWRLQADAAKQQEQGMYLTEPRLEMFTETGEAIPIQGHEAWFNPIRKNIHFKGEVKISHREWTLRSEELRYNSKRDEVVVPGKFEVKKPGVTMRGRGLRVDRKTERLTVDHDVWIKDATSRSMVGRP
ncbi:MAG: LPS export ABC transporter periplasmic protein LptC [Mariprofundaceae bacterium]